MSSIKNILVALDLSALDKQLITYASYIAELTKAENVYFVHNIKKFETSELFQKEFEAMNLEQLIENKIEKSIQKYYSSNIPHEVLISDDVYTEGLINYIANKYLVDLVIVGNKNTYKGTGAVSGKLLRMLKCDVLSIPSSYTLPPKKLLCTTDFSSKSHKGIKRGLTIKKLTGGDLACLNVHKIPAQFFPLPTLNLDKVKNKIELHTQKAFTKLFTKLKMDQVTSVSALAGEDSVPEKVRKIAEKEYDLVFISDRGHNNFTSLFVGSITEELFTHYLEVPLWVVKSS